ncbi:MAG: hypothetical protein RBT25_04815 [Lentisphaeria bacterium]|nr:hypothetical protein [Lentisphaeria bacterium]
METTKKILEEIAALADSLNTDQAFKAWSEGYSVTREGFYQECFLDAAFQLRDRLIKSDQLRQLVAQYSAEEVLHALDCCPIMRPGIREFSRAQLADIAKKCEEASAQLARARFTAENGKPGDLDDLARLYPADVERHEQVNTYHVYYQAHSLSGQIALDLIKGDPELRPSDAMRQAAETVRRGGRPGNLDDLARLFPSALALSWKRTAGEKIEIPWPEEDYLAKMADHTAILAAATAAMKADKALTPLQAVELAISELEAKEARRKAQEAEEDAARREEFLKARAQFAAALAPDKPEAPAKRNTLARMLDQQDGQDGEPEEEEETAPFGTGAFDALSDLKL